MIFDKNDVDFNHGNLKESLVKLIEFFCQNRLMNFDLNLFLLHKASSKQHHQHFSNYQFFGADSQILFNEEIMTHQIDQNVQLNSI